MQEKKNVDTKPQAMSFTLAGGTPPLKAQPSAPNDLTRPQMIFFPISGATSPLKQI